MRNCCRVFLKTNDDLRSFFWFAVGHDRSIYFASSNSRKYRRGFHALAKIPVGGATVNPETDGRPISREEIDNYHSLHRSGVFASPMIEMGKRIRNKITPLDEHVGPLPLVTILPMEPHKYPVASRTPRPTDMIIDISSLLHQPFALMCYTSAERIVILQLRSAKLLGQFICKLTRRLETLICGLLSMPTPLHFSTGRNWNN